MLGVDGMPIITLPDGSKREYGEAVSAEQIAHDISPRLGKDVLAANVNACLVDTHYMIESDATVTLITPQMPEGLDILRHSTAHLLAQAVKELFPSAQVTIGPVIEDGFYYDFAFERSFTLDDLAHIEKRMHEIVKKSAKVVREEMPRDDAIAYFREMGEEYKARIIEDIPENEVISLYRQGDFVDLCRGPHVPHMGHLGVFKLMKVAGAYWRGDANNEMLQRIYGTAWSKKSELKDYLKRLEEAEKRDHRRLGKQLHLFHFQEEAPGMVFWHGKGFTIYRLMQNYLRQKLEAYGYEEIKTPQLLSRSLWEKSGHWEKYREEMFTTNAEDHIFAIKPMSCPCHVQVYKQGLKSYRDLPLRMAEFGCCHRNEFSGTLHGLMRVRAFTQDDAHIFCTEDQIADEIEQLIDLVHDIYTDFGFEQISCCVSTRPEHRVGSEETWDRAEKALQDVLNNKGLPWDLAAGDGAFYGPKIDFTLKDCLGRMWQCGTIQLDFSMPGRLGATYVDENGSKQVPVMIHRAILGTLERFMGIFIEQCEAKFPLWLAPVQAVVMTITDAHADYASTMAKYLRKNGFRVDKDLRNEKIGFKIREHTIQRIPYLLIVGDKEVETNTVAVRSLSGKDLGSKPLSELKQLFDEQIASKR